MALKSIPLMPFIFNEYLSLLFMFKPGKSFNSFETAHSKRQIQIDLVLYLFAFHLSWFTCQYNSLLIFRSITKIMGRLNLLDGNYEPRLIRLVSFQVYIPKNRFSFSVRVPRNAIPNGHLFELNLRLVLIRWLKLLSHLSSK